MATEGVKGLITLPEVVRLKYDKTRTQQWQWRKSTDWQLKLVLCVIQLRMSRHVNISIHVSLCCNVYALYLLDLRWFRL